MKPNLRDVHFFNEHWPADTFKGCGVRGWWLRLLNALRWRLELRVNWHAMHILSEKNLVNVYQARTEWQRDHLPPPTRTFVEAPYTATTVQEPTPTRALVATPAETSEVISRLMANPRSRRYAHSRREYRMYDLDPVLGEPDAENTKASN